MMAEVDGHNAEDQAQFQKQFAEIEQTRTEHKDRTRAFDFLREEVESLAEDTRKKANLIAKKFNEHQAKGVIGPLKINVEFGYIKDLLLEKMMLTVENSQEADDIKVEARIQNLEKKLQR